MLQLEFHRMLQADRERELQEALRRRGFIEASLEQADSDGVDGVPLGDRTGGRGDAGADVGWSQDLHPAPGAEQGRGRLLRPVHAQPEP